MVYGALIVFIAIAVVAVHCRLGYWRGFWSARFAVRHPPNPWHDAGSWMRNKITYTAFCAMSPPEKENLRRLVAYGRGGPPELYRALALDNKPYVLVIAANNGGYVYSALDAEEVPEPEQIADLAKDYDCPVFLFTRNDMLT